MKAGSVFLLRIGHCDLALTRSRGTQGGGSCRILFLRSTARRRAAARRVGEGASKNQLADTPRGDEGGQSRVRKICSREAKLYTRRRLNLASATIQGRGRWKLDCERKEVVGLHYLNALHDSGYLPGILCWFRQL